MEGFINDWLVYDNRDLAITPCYILPTGSGNHCVEKNKSMIAKL